MDIDHILSVLNRREVRYLLIGGVHFLLRHKPVLTFDIDFWIEDDTGNRLRCEGALADLDAEWGQTDKTWGPVAALPTGWLGRQTIFCLSSPHGAIDIFRSVSGLPSWQQSFARSVSGQTAAGTVYRGLSDADMLACQLSLDPEDRQLEERKRDRNWNAQERWRLIQEAMTWAEAQSTVRRNSPQSRLAEQARKLAFMAKSPAIPANSRH